MKIKKTYSELLKDPRWQKMRLKILERDEFTCRHCGGTDETLHVHHKYYENGNLPWEYPTEALVTLCEPCHKEEECLLQENPKIFMDAFRRSGFFADDLKELAYGMGAITLNENYSSFKIACAYSHALKKPEIQLLLIELFEKDLQEIINSGNGLFNKVSEKVD